MDLATKPSVLFIYFTYTNQTRKVMDAMAEVLRDRVSHLVAVHRRPGPVLPAVRHREPGLEGQAVRRRRRLLPPVLEAQPRDGAQTRHRTWRRLRRRHSLPLPGWPGALAGNHLEEARKFADGLANRLAGNAPVSVTSHEPGDGSAVGRTCSASITSGVSPAATATANHSWTPWPGDGSPPDPACKIPAAAALTGELSGRVFLDLTLM